MNGSVKGRTKINVRGREHYTPPTPERRKARGKLAKRFLDEVLLPRIEHNTLVHGPEEIHKLYHDFAKENHETGGDFDLAHVWSIAWQWKSVNDCLAENSPERLPANAVDVAVAEALLHDAVFGHDPHTEGNHHGHNKLHDHHAQHG